jgi:hypothetical protein
MRWQGHNILAIIVAAIVMYGVGFVIYGVVFEELWMQLSGITAEEAQSEPWRMALSPAMPILQAAGLSLAIKWRGAVGWMGGLGVGFWMGLCFVFASRLYSFVYGTEAPALLGIDALHLFLINMVGGAIIGAWK